MRINHGLVIIIDALFSAFAYVSNFIVLTYFINPRIQPLQFIVALILSSAALNMGRRVLYSTNKVAALIIRFIAVAVGLLLVYKVLIPYGYSKFAFYYAILGSSLIIMSFVFRKSLSNLL
jgi:hypothetical protein